MNSILITGHTGFVGKNLCQYLQTKNLYELFFLGRNTSINFSNITQIKEHTIIHLAGLAHDLQNQYTYQDYYKVNFELTKKLFDLFLASPQSKCFIFISTVAVINKVETTFTENDPINPQTPYGKTKALAEEYILKNAPANKKVLVLRPVMIHGNGNKGNLNLLFQLIKKGIPYPLAKFKNQRSFIGIDNFNFLMHEILQNQNKLYNGIYHLADDEPTETLKILELIGQETNQKVKLLVLPKFVLKSIAKIGDFLPLPLNTNRLQKLTENFLVSNQKIKTILNLKNLPLTAQEGLKKTIKSLTS